MTQHRKQQIQNTQNATKTNVFFAIILLTVFLFLFVKTSKSQVQAVKTAVDSTGTAGYNGDGIKASLAHIGNTNAGGFTGDIITDNNGNVIYADYENHRVRRIDKTTNIITTIAGTGVGGYNGDNVLATNAQLFHPLGLAFDAANNLYISDLSNIRIRKIDAITGIITTIAGDGVFGTSTTFGDGGLAINARFSFASHITIDGFNNLYFVDNYRVRKINLSTGIISAFAGQYTYGFSNDAAVLATSTSFGGIIYGLLANNAGDVYITDGGRIRKVSGGIITTVVGHYWDNGQLFGGDGGQATVAYYAGIGGLCFNSYGEILMCDINNNLIRKYNITTGIITTIAGDTHNGYPFLWGGFAGDGGNAINARFYHPSAITYNNVTNETFIVDAGNNRIRKTFSPCTPIIVNRSVTVCSSALPYHWAGLTLTATGNYTVHQTLASGCDSSATLHFTVLGTMPPITGATNVCIGGSVQLSDSFVGGNWNRVSGGANVSSTGVVTGLAAGQVVVRYSFANELGCNATATYNITVNSIPTVPSMAYVAGTPNPQTGTGGAFCVGRTFKLVGYSPVAPIVANLTGVWSSSDTTLVSVAPAGSGNNRDTALVVIKAPGAGVTLTYRVTSPAGCSNYRAITFSTSVTCPYHRGASNEEAIASSVQFTMYPNPARSTVSLQVEKLVGAGSIIVTDLYGKQVKTQSLSMGNNTVNISNLSKGFYLVSVITSEGKTTKKLVVE